MAATPVFFRYRLAFYVALFAAAMCAVMLGEHPILFRLIERPPTITGRALTALSGLLLIVGAFFRILGEARLRHVVYGQGATDALHTGGIFSASRNPLYFGLTLIYVGAAMFWAPLVVTLALTLVFVGLNHLIVRYEETLLSARYGKAYADYVENVPRMFPRWPREPVGAGAPHLWFAFWGNLGFVSLGLYRLSLAALGPVRWLGGINLLLVVAWATLFIVRRLRAGSSTGNTADAETDAE